jgi:hypothetical protein
MFEALFPGYHELDRVAVVSPRWEDGVLHTGVALLALTTAFYDAMRARETTFFNYPQHFALLGESAGLSVPGEGPLDCKGLGATWGNLDVWPETNWLGAPATAAGMLRKLFEIQINRLFWPELLVPGPGDALLPAYARRIMASRLKSVHYYRTASPNVELQASPTAVKVIRGSVSRLPGEGAGPAQGPSPTASSESETGLPPRVEPLRHVTPSDFLAEMAACFQVEG